MSGAGCLASANFFATTFLNLAGLLLRILRALARGLDERDDGAEDGEADEVFFLSVVRCGDGDGDGDLAVFLVDSLRRPVAGLGEREFDTPFLSALRSLVAGLRERVGDGDIDLRDFFFETLRDFLLAGLDEREDNGDGDEEAADFFFRHLRSASVGLAFAVLVKLLLGLLLWLALFFLLVPTLLATFLVALIGDGLLLRALLTKVRIEECGLRLGERDAVGEES
jgi:hypothetical protein